MTMQNVRKGNKLIFVIVDEVDFTWGVAATELRAESIIKWFLPKGGKYHIEPCVILVDMDLI